MSMPSNAVAAWLRAPGSPSEPQQSVTCHPCDSSARDR